MFGLISKSFLSSLFVASGYNKDSPPSDSNATVVSFGVTPLCFQLSNDGILSGRIWYMTKWTDSRLKFNPEHFGGVNAIRVSPTEIWIPDIALYNRYVKFDN